MGLQRSSLPRGNRPKDNPVEDRSCPDCGKQNLRTTLDLPVCQTADCGWVGRRPIKSDP